MLAACQVRSQDVQLLGGTEVVLCNCTTPAGGDGLVATGRSDHSEQAPQVQRLMIEHWRHLRHGIIGEGLRGTEVVLNLVSCAKPAGDTGQLRGKGANTSSSRRRRSSPAQRHGSRRRRPAAGRRPHALVGHSCDPGRPCMQAASPRPKLLPAAALLTMMSGVPVMLSNSSFGMSG